MRRRIVIAIFAKEILETLRDRRTLAVMLLLPMAMYPLLILVFGQVVTHQMSRMQQQTTRVLIKGYPPESFRQVLEKAEHLRLRGALGGPPAPATIPLAADDAGGEAAEAMPTARLPDSYETWARDVLDARRADVILVFARDTSTRLAAGQMAPVLIYYDETEQFSREAQGRMTELLTQWRDQLRRDRLAAHPYLPDGFMTPLHIESANTATAAKRGGFLAGRIIPLVLMVMVMLGAFYPAIDLTAGEKERGTMQTLLTAPARSTEIIIGKFLTVFVVAMISALANLISMSLAIAWMLRSTPRSAEFVFHIDWGVVLMVLVQLVPIAVFFSAIMLAIAVFAHSFKEAQNYLTPVYMLVIVPAGIAALPTVRLDTFTACAPGLNIMLLMRELMVEPPSGWLVALTLVANTVFAILALAAAVRIFQSEQVLLGGQLPVSDMLQLRSDRGQATPLLAVAAYLLLLLLLYYLGTIMQETSLFWGMLGTQWLLILLPVVIAVRWQRLDARQTLSLRKPDWRALVGAFLVGATAWAVLGRLTLWLQERILETPPAVEEAMRQALGVDGTPVADWRLLLAFAVSPAICEELFFRGLLLGSLRDRLGKWSAIIVVGLFFGFFHFSIYRMFPTAVLGIVIAWIVYQSRSIYTGIALHLAYNGTAILAMRHGWFPALTGVDPSQPLWPWLSGATLLLLVGMYLARRAPVDAVD